MSLYIKIVAVMFCLGLIVVSGQNTFACSCGVRSPMEAFEDSTVVFVGKVVEIVRPPSKTVSRRNSDGSFTVSVFPPGPETVVLAVSRRFKGVNTEDFSLKVSSSSGCGYQFEKNESYLIYGLFNDGKLVTDTCRRTTMLSKATEEIKYFEAVAKDFPQAIVFGGVLWRIVDERAITTLQARLGEFQIVAESDKHLYRVTAEDWGQFQISVVPGEYRLWVEENGKRVSESKIVVAEDRQAVREVLKAKWEYSY